MDCDGGLDIVILESESVCLWTMMVEGGVYNERVDKTLGFPAKKEFALCK